MTDSQVKELEAIRRKNPQGLLVPREVVAAARSKKSTLHGEFTWDDGKAAEKYREEEARTLIRAYVTYEPRVERQARGYVSVPSDRTEGGGYRQTGAAISRAGYAAEMFAEIAARIAGMRASYRHFAPADRLWDILEAEVGRYIEAQSGSIGRDAKAA